MECYIATMASLLVTTNQSKNGVFMTSQSFLGVLNDVYIKIQIFTLKWWKLKMWPTLKIYIEFDLFAKMYVNDSKSNISKTMGVLNKFKHFVPLNAWVMIYNSLILSHIKYCILA